MWTNYTMWLTDSQVVMLIKRGGKMFNTLKKLMDEEGMTGYKLAKITGISSPDIYRALSGKQQMFEGWKKRIAAAMGRTVEEVFPEDEKGGEGNEQS